eukprot:m.569806 g.569806  ORF g.569806 m.569806 type:complete len:147 (-) comp57842_c2_seq4:235-675(-)
MLIKPAQFLAPAEVVAHDPRSTIPTTATTASIRPPTISEGRSCKADREASLLRKQKIRAKKGSRRWRLNENRKELIENAELEEEDLTCLPNPARGVFHAVLHDDSAREQWDQFQALSSQVLLVLSPHLVVHHRAEFLLAPASLSSC